MKGLILFSIIVACGFVENVVSYNNQFPYRTIINFGDSLSDTGNSATNEPFKADSPYGSTYFKHPAGRMSNGRLIIDFIGTYTLFSIQKMTSMIFVHKKYYHIIIICYQSYTFLLTDDHFHFSQSIWVTILASLSKFNGRTTC